jgi:outer membrane protein assembly factor BamD
VIVARRHRIGVAGVAVLLAGGWAACAKGKGVTNEDSRAFLPAEALYQRGVEQLAEDNLRRAREDLERIQFTPENLQMLEPLVKLRLADITFYKGDDLSLIDARTKYLDFVTLHGDHPLAPYAQFQAGICSLKQVGSPTEDQSQTETALAELREVVRRYGGSSYGSAAQGIIAEAEGYLAAHEFAIGQFYLKKKVYNAAATRFRNILDRYPSYIEKDKVYFSLGKALVLGEKVVEGRPYLDRVVDDYPNGPYAKDAAKLLAKSEAQELEKKEDEKAEQEPGPEPAPESDAEPRPAGKSGVNSRPHQNSRDCSSVTRSAREG